MAVHRSLPIDPRIIDKKDSFSITIAHKQNPQIRMRTIFLASVFVYSLSFTFLSDIFATSGMIRPIPRRRHLASCLFSSPSIIDAFLLFFFLSLFYYFFLSFLLFLLLLSLSRIFHTFLFLSYFFLLHFLACFIFFLLLLLFFMCFLSYSFDYTLSREQIQSKKRT
ncbi:unnamed protein product [Acanthosepion pharaonis]|uniref:Transmembrane protein n=1 Tax=Acanthosepion pharaonis TaxID=158019 RepID=A0A812BLI0_ACAPH|nr:unnamed protein product [Sepia pharaonis]